MKYWLAMTQLLLVFGNILIQFNNLSKNVLNKCVATSLKRNVQDKKHSGHYSWVTWSNIHLPSPAIIFFTFHSVLFFTWNVKLWIHLVEVLRGWSKMTRILVSIKLLIDSHYNGHQPQKISLKCKQFFLIPYKNVFENFWGKFLSQFYGFFIFFVGPFIF